MSMLGFEQLQDRLLMHIRERIRSGELTERGLARMTGISQPHVHNVLKGKRFFSLRAADAVLLELRLDVIDLIEPDDLSHIMERR